MLSAALKWWTMSNQEVGSLDHVCNQCSDTFRVYECSIVTKTFPASLKRVYIVMYLMYVAVAVKIAQVSSASPTYKS